MRRPVELSGVLAHASGALVCVCGALCGAGARGLGGWIGGMGKI